MDESRTSLANKRRSSTATESAVIFVRIKCTAPRVVVCDDDWKKVGMRGEMSGRYRARRSETCGEGGLYIGRTVRAGLGRQGVAGLREERDRIIFSCRFVSRAGEFAISKKLSIPGQKEEEGAPGTCPSTCVERARALTAADR